MSSVPKKPSVPGASSRASPNPPSSSPGQNSRSPSRTSTTSTTNPASSTNGVTRTRSTRNGTPLSARGAVRKPGTPSNLSTSASQDDAEEDARAESAALIQDLKDRLQKAEASSEEHRRQGEILQVRLDESQSEQAKLEEKVHEEEERVEGLENEKRELVRQRRELESIYEAERASFMKQKEESHSREDELSEIIQRLKEGQAHRDLRPGPDDGKLSRASSFRSNSRSNSEQNLDNGQFAPSGSVQRSDSRNNSKLILQKDKVIESLRLELAEAQIKLVEVENQGGGRLQELERILLETRMTNARLMEDNESFQVLLGEKTLNGDFSRSDFMRGTNSIDERPATQEGPSTSLADELESAEDIGDVEHTRRLEAEVNKLKEQNKALTLYINKIIERVLQHQGFESILDKNDLDEPSKPNTDKDLPPPPPPKENTAPSFLQRAKSIAQRTTTAATSSTDTRKPRPMSYVPPPPQQPTSVVEDPNTAPSVPLARSNTNRHSSGNFHRRSTSEWPAAGIVSNMYRGPLPAASGQVSPGIASPRNSFFGSIPGPTATSNPSSRVPSAGAMAPPPVPNEDLSTYQPRPSSGTGTVTPSHDTPPPLFPGGTINNSTGEVSLDTPSPPRSVASSFDRPGGAVMSGKGVRPLRLVQEAKEQDAAEERARKVQNRSSWIPAGWFGKTEGQGAQGS